MAQTRQGLAHDGTGRRAYREQASNAPIPSVSTRWSAANPCHSSTPVNTVTGSTPCYDNHFSNGPGVRSAGQIAGLLKVWQPSSQFSPPPISCKTPQWRQRAGPSARWLRVSVARGAVMMSWRPRTTVWCCATSRLWGPKSCGTTPSMN